MNNLKYCKICVLPNTRPNINFDECGNCNCATSEKKDEINWSSRQRDFNELISKVKARGAAYDCIIPVSGGKDSTWQVLKALEYGLRPLCVTWKTPARSSLGQENLNNLISLGVNHIDFAINPNVEKLFTRKAFERFGTPVIPMHMALHAIPLQIAVNYKIPLILWGENAAFEYGGDDQSLKGFTLTSEWLKTYGVTNGTSHKDWVDNELSEEDLAPYAWPSDEEQKASGVKAVFLGHYFRWDPHETYSIARENGFKSDIKPRTGYYKYADIDDEFLITIHHYLKWFKFGFTRTWDNLSIEIRNSRMTRDQAISLLEKIGDERPELEIKKFCNYTEMSVDRFNEICEKFRNKNIWVQDAVGVWKIDNFLFKNKVWR